MENPMASCGMGAYVRVYLTTGPGIAERTFAGRYGGAVGGDVLIMQNWGPGGLAWDTQYPARFAFDEILNWVRL